MTIIQIGPFPINPSIIQGGVEASVYGLAIAQSESDRVYVLDTPRRDAKDCLDNVGGISIYRFNNPGKHQKDAVVRVEDMLNIVLSLKPDICHIHGTSFLSNALIKSLRKSGIPVILTVHGLATIEKRNALKQHFSIKTLYQYLTQSRCEKKILSSQETVLVDTNYVVRAIKGFKLRRSPQMVVIPQGINDIYYSLNSSKTSRTILSVGSISRRKGHIQLVKAFNIAAQEIEDINLIICGVLADVQYFAELKNVISSLPNKDRITLMTNVPKEELVRLYSRAHLFALHTQEESQGIVFAEAMAGGLPIVSTTVGGVPDIVQDGKCGILSNYGDIDSFAESMVILMKSISTWERMSSNCKKASAYYSWETIRNRVENEYKRAISL